MTDAMSFGGLPPEFLRELGARYRFEREISGGLMARVIRVYDMRLERTVALKLLRPEVGLSVGRDRFLDEIRIAASLVHPHVMPVHDSGISGGLLYFTMPFIEGGSLRGRLERDGQLSREETVRVSRAMADALSYAHSRGIVHRDVKPENVMLDGSAVLLADFGIARLMRPEAGSTRTSAGLTVGTPGYMSPEQAAGHRELDGRSDIYSLACVVYEMLAGEPPFTGPSPQAVIARHLGDTPRPIRIVRASLPASVDTILGRALSKSPADRYASPSEFIGQLERALLTPGEQQVTVLTPPASIAPRRLSNVQLGLGAATMGVAALLWYLSGASIDRQRIAVFPLSGTDSATAAGAVTYLGYVLEGTEPLRWENGAEWLQNQGRQATTGGTAGLGRLARSKGAGLFLDGQVVEEADSTTVVMRLYDVAGDSLLARRGHSGPRGASIPQLAAAATAEVLPLVVGGGAAADVAGLRRRSPAAIANLLQGDVAYQAARYEDASRFYMRALESDSGFPLPKVRAAQALLWLDRQEVVESLLVSALAAEPELPGRYRGFARAALHKAQGQADSALDQVHRSIQADSTWAEAWMLMGEIHYHLLPDVMGGDSLASLAFATARRRDPSFLPPVYHLAEIALRAGNIEAAASLLDTLRLNHADTGLTRPLSMMVRCASGAMTQPDWDRELSAGSVDVLEAAKSLSGSARYLTCSEQGFRAVAEWDSTSPAQRFGAFQGLQGVLLARGLDAAVRDVLDSERGRVASAHYFHVFNSAAGLGFDSEAEDVVREIEARAPPRSNSALWLLGIWYARRGNAAVARSLSDSLQLRAVASGSATTALLARIVAAHATLAAGDTAAAIAALEQLRPIARQRELAWTPWDALALERLTLARLYLARGSDAGVLRVGSAFDAAHPIMFVGLRPRMLAIRAEAAERLREHKLAERYRARLAAFSADADAPAPAGRT